MTRFNSRELPSPGFNTALEFAAAPAGDVVTGAATVILAMGAGKAAAKGIDEFLRREKK